MTLDVAPKDRAALRRTGRVEHAGGAAHRGHDSRRRSAAPPAGYGMLLSGETDTAQEDFLGDDKMRMSKRYCRAALARQPPCWLTSAQQTYPSRTVTVVVPIAAGGAVDTTARIFAEQLQAKLGQPFVVENRTGAGAIIGTELRRQGAAGRLHAAADGKLRAAGEVDLQDAAVRPAEAISRRSRGWSPIRWCCSPNRRFPRRT